MAPRKMKDRRGSTDVKEEPLSEAASSALGDDANQKKKRGRPRKAASAGEAGTYTEGNPGGIEEEEEGEEEGEASNEEGTYEEDQKGPSAAMGAALPNEQKKEVIVMKKKTRRVTHHRHHIMNGRRRPTGARVVSPPELPKLPSNISKVSSTYNT
ncbi:hypothetical protein GOP47_0028266 [Adiantum capillus-veneris]|nr:hypothetical protein GOP47_0028266 [Adiantum capillus-veneris]